MLYCIVLYCIVLYCIVLYCIVLYCIVLYRIVSCYVVSYYIILYYVALRTAVLCCVVSTLITECVIEHFRPLPLSLCLSLSHTHSLPLHSSLSSGELWSLLSFVLPGIFNDLDQFSGWFNRPFENMEEDESSDDEFGQFLLYDVIMYYI